MSSYLRFDRRIIRHSKLELKTSTENRQRRIAAPIRRVISDMLSVMPKFWVKYQVTSACNVRLQPVLS